MIKGYNKEYFMAVIGGPSISTDAYDYMCLRCGFIERYAVNPEAFINKDR